MISRRQLLQTTLASGFLWSLPRWARAQAPLRHYFLSIGVSGGMDSTLGLDPVLDARHLTPEDVFLEYRPEELAAGPIVLGPSALPLQSLISEMAVIRGVHMRRDSGHDSLHQYLFAGNGNGTTPVFAAQMTAREPQDLRRMLMADNAIGPTGNLRLIQNSAFNELMNGAQAAGGEIAPPPSSAEYDALLTAMAGELGRLDEAKKILASLPQINEAQDLRTFAVAVKMGWVVAGHIELRTNQNLDTHSNHPGTHLSSQAEIWSSVASIVQFLKNVPHGQGSLYDATTLMVGTEFSRTPGLNNSRGKDHNPETNSVLLLGHGVRGGQVVGESIVHRRTANSLSRHIGLPLNYATGEIVRKLDGLNSDVAPIYPENVAATLAELFERSFGVNFETSGRTIPKIIA